MLPDIVILDCTEDLQRLKSALISGLDMPNLIDWQNVLEQLMACTGSLADFEKNLLQTCHHISEDIDALHENWHVEDDGWQAVSDAIAVFAHALKNKLVQLGVYTNQNQPYVFWKFLDANSILISKPTACSPQAVPRPTTCRQPGSAQSAGAYHFGYV